MQKNVSGQKILIFAFTQSDATPKTGLSDITVKISKDYAASVAATNSVGESESGYYILELTQAETNATAIDFFCTSATSGVSVLAQPARVWTTPENFNALAIESGGDLTDTTTHAKLDTIDDFLDTEIAAIKAVTDALPNSGALTDIAADVTSVLADTSGGVAITTATAQAIADEVLKRGVSGVEASADDYSLCTIILATLESSIDSTTWTIRRTDATTHLTRTVTVDASASPITGVD